MWCGQQISEKSIILSFVYNTCLLSNVIYYNIGYLVSKWLLMTIADWFLSSLRNSYKSKLAAIEKEQNISIF